MYDNGVSKIADVVEWFQNLQVVFPSSKYLGLPIKMAVDEVLKEFIAEKLNSMDTGVTDVSVANDEIDFNEFAENVGIPRELQEKIADSGNGILNYNGQYFIFLENERKRLVVLKLQFRHYLNGRPVMFDLDDESDGTKRLLDLLPMLFAMGQNSQTIYIIDEIDRSLHTKLTKHILTDFAEKSMNTNNQLIFTAHDVNLMDDGVLRREEVWLIEKSSPTGESQLRPLSDFPRRDGQDTLKAYLHGRFGAVPKIRGGK